MELQLHKFNGQAVMLHCRQLALNEIRRQHEQLQEEEAKDFEAAGAQLHEFFAKHFEIMPDIIQEGRAAVVVLDREVDMRTFVYAEKMHDCDDVRLFLAASAPDGARRRTVGTFEDDNQLGSLLLQLQETPRNKRLEAEKSIPIPESAKSPETRLVEALRDFIIAELS